MDLMEIRRGLLAQMAKGAEIIKGTFEAINTGGSYTLDWGKSFSKFILIIEMTDASKTTLLASGQTSAKMFECLTQYPMPTINNDSASNAILSNRIIPTTSVISTSASSAGTVTEHSITMTCNNIGSGSNVLYNGYEYNYTVISLD